VQLKPDAAIDAKSNAEAGRSVEEREDLFRAATSGEMTTEVPEDSQEVG
jgi:hypothetical protein